MFYCSFIYHSFLWRLTSHAAAAAKASFFTVSAPKKTKQTFLFGDRNRGARFSNGATSCKMVDGWRCGPKGHETVLILEHKMKDMQAIDLVEEACAISKPIKVLGLDFDGTVAVSSRGEEYWKPRFSHVFESLRRLVAGDGKDESSSPYGIVAIITNESLGSYKKEQTLRKALHSKSKKIEQFCARLDLPCVVLMPTAKDQNRKGVGIASWTLLEGLLERKGFKVEKESCCYVGDAAGGKSFSDSDKVFAESCGLRFHTEKEFFGRDGEGRRDTVEEASAVDAQPAEEKKLQKLEVTYDDVSLSFEAMFVEVKSKNDTLDARQESWLNIMESAGLKATICKVKPPQSSTSNEMEICELEEKKKVTATSGSNTALKGGSRFFKCPMCQKSFSLSVLERHAFDCNGVGVAKAAKRQRASGDFKD